MASSADGGLHFDSLDGGDRLREEAHSPENKNKNKNNNINNYNNDNINKNKNNLNLIQFLDGRFRGLRDQNNNVAVLFIILLILFLLIFTVLAGFAIFERIILTYYAKNEKNYLNPKYAEGSNLQKLLLHISFGLVTFLILPFVSFDLLLVARDEESNNNQGNNNQGNDNQGNNNQGNDQGDQGIREKIFT